MNCHIKLHSATPFTNKFLSAGNLWCPDIKLRYLLSLVILLLLILQLAKDSIGQSFKAQNLSTTPTMSFRLASWQLSSGAKRILPSIRTRGAIIVSQRSFTLTRVGLFRSKTQRQGQAGLAPAPEPEYLPEDIIEGLPQTGTHYSEIPQAPFRTAESPCKMNFAPDIQAMQRPVMEASSSEAIVSAAAIPAYHRGSKFDRVPYWQNIGRWKDVTEKQFLSYSWGVSNIPPQHRVRSTY